MPIHAARGRGEGSAPRTAALKRGLREAPQRVGRYYYSAPCYYRRDTPVGPANPCTCRASCNETRLRRPQQGALVACFIIIFGERKTPP